MSQALPDMRIGDIVTSLTTFVFFSKCLASRSDYISNAHVRQCLAHRYHYLTAIC